VPVPVPLRSGRHPNPGRRRSGMRCRTTWRTPKGFLGALFDSGFQSFVTTEVVKVLYVLIMIGTVVSALVLTIVAFKASLTFGVATLLFGDPRSS
jgi:hypothetical protein